MATRTFLPLVPAAAELLDELRPSSGREAHSFSAAWLAALLVVTGGVLGTAEAALLRRWPARHPA